MVETFAKIYKRAAARKGGEKVPRADATAGTEKHRFNQN
jgi:hypothetical protein